MTDHINSPLNIVCPLTNNPLDLNSGMGIATCFSCKHCLPPAERINGNMCGLILQNESSNLTQLAPSNPEPITFDCESQYNPPCAIYINRHSGNVVSEGYPNSIAYFNEDSVRKLLRKEYEQANKIIDYASRCTNPLNDGLINVDKSIERAIDELKGANQ